MKRKRKLTELEKLEKLVQESIKNTEAYRIETEKKIEAYKMESAEQIKKLKENMEMSTRQFGEFTNKFGYFVAGLVPESIAPEFMKIGIEVSTYSKGIKGKYNGKSFEFDIISVGKTIKDINSELPKGIPVVIVTEVKADMKPEDVKDKKEKILNFKTYLPEYANFKMMMAVAAVNFSAESDIYAQREGFFVFQISENIFKMSKIPKNIVVL